MPLNDVTLLLGEKRVLEMVATSSSVREVLEALITLIEAQEPGVRCGVLTIAADGARVSDSYGASLPPAYHAAMIGQPIAPPYLGACAEAAHRGEPVAVLDIATCTGYASANPNIGDSAQRGAV